MIKLYLISIGIIMMLLTTVIGILKPSINKPVRFAGGDFQITNTEIAQNPAATHQISDSNVQIVNTELTETKNIEKQIETKSPDYTETTKLIENKENKTVKNIEIQNDAPKFKTTDKKVNIQTPPRTQKDLHTAQPAPQKQEKEVTVEIPQSVKDILNNKHSEPAKQTESAENKVVKLPQINPTPKPAQTAEKTIEQVPENDRPLTEQEEIIVWNIWRSNLQNQIMRDTQIGAPLGTAFKFSFTVDKRGRISNLKTWAVPSSYNGIAVNYLKPLILSYQGQSILNFPSRTKRVITNVTGGFVISTQDRFSTPNDFQDIEKIKTLR